MLKKIDPFILGLLFAIVLAWLFPGLGESENWYSLKELSGFGISLIFFFYGLKLSPKQMMEGVSNYKLHLLVQFSTFLLFPLLIIAIKGFFQSEEASLIWLGLFFLAALPSTVSSSVVMVSIAKGNIPGAIFNASISGLIGIVLTPIWMSLFIGSQDAEFSLLDSFVNLFIRILLPVIIGLALNKHLGAFAKKHSSKLTLFDKTIILLIVYQSFGNSFKAGLFESLNALDLSLLFAGIILLFTVVYFLISKLSDLFNFSREDKITAQFAGSKKSLVHGTVFSKVLFANMASQGLLLLPIMIYHAMQLVVISVIAERKGVEII